jgi:ATP-dependent DNA helicase RecQ
MIVTSGSMGAVNLFPSLRLRYAARRHFGWRRLRAGQLAAMRALLRGRDALVILPTGAGKSAVYQVPASLLPGPTLVISPLLALQHDQITGVNERGIAHLHAVYVNSSQTPRQREEALERVRTGASRLLFMTPEQMAAPERLAEVAALRPSLVAVDEAHCVSTWGHDFRPDYLALGHAIRALGRPPVVALTATASPPVREDIATLLGLRDPALTVGGLDRPNLMVQAVHCPTEEHRWRRLRDLMDAGEGSGIVYVPTRRAAERLAERLTGAGYRAADYHGGMPAGTRRARHEAFAAGTVEAMVATSAFGMGIDKADIRWVAHMALPDSPDSYLQEIGRAGRDGRPARVLLLYRPEDIALQRFFTGGAPDADDLTYVAAGVRAGVRTRAALAERTGMSARKVAALLALLEHVGAVAVGADKRLFVPDEAPQPADAARHAVAEAERRRVVQRSRIEMMRQLAETPGCRMRPLLAYFGEQLARPCGHCDNCERGSGDVPPPAASGVTAEQAPAPAPEGDAPYPLHSTVRHTQWGLGTVLGYDRDRMTVLFDEVGYKSLSVPVVRDNGLLVADGGPARGTG